MHNFTLRLNLLDDVVFSASSATEGGHTSLDYIPGSALLGWAASQLYSTLKIEDAWLLFHSGKVRFGHGLPATDSLDTFKPMPACFHYAKNSEWRGADNRLCKEQVFNLTHTIPDPDGQVQYKQLREGYISPDGMLFYPEKSLSMKTAINPNTGRAAESQLFGYEALVAGQTFISTITADSDVPEELMLRLKEVCSGVMHLGRSRASQYGRVESIEISNTPCFGRVGGEFVKNLTLWLMSDMALYHHGQTVLKPEPRDLGLPAGHLVIERSFVRHRCYTPYNAKRRAPDLERQVLAAGSILHFELDEPVDSAQLPQSFGIFRESGLGKVWINPPLLDAKHPLFEQAIEHPALEKIAMPNHPLLHWLKKASTAIEETKQIHQTVDERMTELRNLYRTAFSMTGIIDAGPGASQWGRVRDVAEQSHDLKQLKTNLFSHDGVCKEGDADWSQVAQINERFIDFRTWLQELIEQENNDHIASIISLLAHEAATERVRKGDRS